MPTFDGDTLAYPEFKRSWQKVAGSNWDKDNQLEQLKFKVDRHIKWIISRCRSMSLQTPDKVNFLIENLILSCNVTGNTSRVRRLVKLGTDFLPLSWTDTMHVARQ